MLRYSFSSLRLNCDVAFDDDAGVVVTDNGSYGSNEGDFIDGRYGRNKIFGGILADEMGLGKTIQIMGVILNNFKAHTLIVLPYSLLSQWENFFISTAGHQPLIYHKKYKNISFPLKINKNFFLDIS